MHIHSSRAASVMTRYSIYYRVSLAPISILS
jgi:hypothetical protein